MNLILLSIIFVLVAVFGYGGSLLYNIKLKYVFIFVLFCFYMIKFVYEYMKSTGKLNKLSILLKLYKSPVINKFKSMLNAKKDLTVRIVNGIMLIDYVYKGSKYHHAVPYDKKNEFKNVRYQVYMVSGDKETEITQHPGTKYKHTAKDYGVDRIKVINKMTGDESIFLDEIPLN